MPTNLEPIVVEPSGEFLGNDGAWSPFLVKVGTPPSSLQLLASTEIPETWVIFSDGCPKPPLNCSDARGGIFESDESKTWSFKTGNSSTSYFKISTEDNLLQLENDGEYGFDTVQVGSPGKDNASVDHQVVAGITTQDFYLGSLGLHNRKILFDGDQQGLPSFISLLISNKLIPSSSYGFTAGASYRPANASLTLGGYDAARFTPNDVAFQFSPDVGRQKVVALQSIWYTDSNSSGASLPLPKGPILTLVDSTVPHIWLPPETCKAFENAFGLTYDPISNLYLINDTIHNALIKQNPSIIFQLSNNVAPGPAINITLPYASFDLEVKTGYNTGVLKDSRYFPLRQANQGAGQYTLGRTFLQESYLIVNYEYGNFSINQVKVSNDPPHIVPIAAAATPTSIGSPSSLPSSITKSTSLPSTPSGSSGGSKSLATPAIAGIAVGIVVILAAFGIWFCRRRRQRKRPTKEPPELPAYPIPPHSAAELGAYNGNQGNEKTPGLIVTDASDGKISSDFDKNRILMEQAGHYPINPAELPGAPGSDLLRPELPSPEPSNRHELYSSEAEVIRSELSTPEPNWPVEMPSPEIGASELGGSTVRGGSSEGRPDSPVFSLMSHDRAQAPSQRTGAGHGHGSIESNADDDNNGNNKNWAAIPETIIPSSSSHSRIPSSNYSTASNSRPPHTRLDSTSSSISSSSLLPRGVGPSYTNYSTRPPHSRMDSNTSDTPSLPTPSTISRRHSMPYPISYSFPRPPHRRLDSKDSSETFETRLELSPPVSPFLPPPSAATAGSSSSSSSRANNANNNSSLSNRGAVVVEALPSTWIPGDGDGTTPSFIIQPHQHHHSSRNSIRSALRSPEPFDSAGFGVEEEDEEYNDDGVGEEREGEVVPRIQGVFEEPEEIIGEQQQQLEEGVHPVGGGKK